MNNLEERTEMEDMRDTFTLGALDAKKMGDYTSFLKKISIARALNRYLDDAPPLKMCSNLLKKFIAYHGLGEPELRYWEKYGEWQTNVLIWLSTFGKEEIKRAVSMQQRASKYRDN